MDPWPSTTLKKGQMNNLWSNCSADTGALTHLNLEKGNQKPPLVEKRKITALVLCKENQQQQNFQIEVSLNCFTTHPECEVCFLREGNLKMHRKSKACQKRKNSQRATDIGQTVLKDDKSLASSLGKAKKITHDIINKTAS